MAAAKAVPSSLRTVRTFKRANKSCPASTLNFLERLPSEILIKILSYLDASALFTVSHISKLFFQLANDNALWKDIYMAEVKKQKPKSMDKLLLKMTTVKGHDQSAGYWKWQYFKTVASYDMKRWKRHLGFTHYTGMPSQTQRVLRNLHVTWELTVSDKSGQECTHEPSWSHFCETSLTLCWSGGGCLPNYQQISTLQLYGVRRIGLNCPSLKTPGWKSLMVKSDMLALTESMHVIGQDRLVELKLLQPGIIVGVWRDQCSIAFVMLTLHFHRLVERSIQGSHFCPYVEPVIKAPFDDTDPAYGLHGYQVHIVLHDATSKLMSSCFPQLSCRRTQIHHGQIRLTAISSKKLSQHTSLSGSITLPWSCEALQGRVENCCLMTLTVLDEFKKPFWCVSTPVSMEQEETSVSYDYDGEHFLINYQDADGQMKMKLVWMKEQKKFIVISLVVYVSVCKVNTHFSRDY